MQPEGPYREKTNGAGSEAHVLARSQKGFTLVELIVVIAVLGILSLILVPQFSLYGDKAMGTTAASDARTAISVCTAHNMDSIDALNQDYLNTYMSLQAVGAGTPADSGVDASNSKSMKMDGTTKINYYYRRGDAILHGVIDLVNGNTTWTTNLAQPKRFNSLAQGLKVTGTTSTSDLTGTVAGAVGTLGFDSALTFQNGK